jgi:hypothetical protein
MTTTTETFDLDRVRANTDPTVLRQIDEGIEERVRFYSAQPREVITRRIEELEREWDIERWLQTNASALALSGVLLSVGLSRKWLLLTTGALGFLFQHAVQGWCPPVPVLRRLGVRTQREIDREKYALKVLRGDFKDIPMEEIASQPNHATQVLNAVSA